MIKNKREQVMPAFFYFFEKNTLNFHLHATI